jgi:hypothetical protein
MTLISDTEKQEVSFSHHDGQVYKVAEAYKGAASILPKRFLN